MKKEIILIGGGGHCHSCIDVIESTEQYKILGIVDKPSLLGEKIMGYDIIGTDDDLPKLAKTVSTFFITVGQIKSSKIRRKIATVLDPLKIEVPSIVSPTAYVSPHANIGKGTIIHHKAFVNAKVTIGNFSIINSGSLIEHDSVVGDYTHISTNATVNGNCTVGSDTFLGSSSFMNQGISIGDACIIASGSAVTKNITNNSLAFGMPLKVRS